jgi:sugar lactone lactonase YvrE
MGQSNYATPYAFKTLAGLVAPPAYVDGLGSGARFYGPQYVAVDGAGNVYVTEFNNHVIRKITSAGVVTTLAGLAGVYGYADGTGSAARFDWPQGVAVDSSGNIYVGDAANGAIRKITSAGVVTTLHAGIGSSEGVAVDSSGNIYVVDMGNSIIRKITPAGVVTTLAGLAGPPGYADGTGSAARFYWPHGVAVDASGNVYVSDAGNHVIRKVTAWGVVTTLAGQAGTYGSADGTGSAARFYSPGGVAVDGLGNVYVADSGNYTIRKIDAWGVVTTLAGLAGTYGSADGTGSAARFHPPEDVAVDGAGNVYVADTGNDTIRKITVAGVVTTLAGQAREVAVRSVDGVGSAVRFGALYGVAVDSAGNLYVADRSNYTIRKIDAWGVVTTLAGLAGLSGYVDGTGSAARFNYPQSVAVDSSGNIYVTEYGYNAIRKITAWGMVTTLAGQYAMEPGLSGLPSPVPNHSADGVGTAARFFGPDGVAVDQSGNVYVADTGNNTIRKVTSNGVVTTLAGLAGSSGSIDGTGSAARFNYPRRVAVDGSGNVYVSDADNHVIRKVTTSGVVTTLAGLAGASGSTDGTGSAARFQGPDGVAVDGAGNVYVADSDNYTIRKITATGVVTTLGGLAGTYSYADGTGSAAWFAYPKGVAVDSAGKVYVADTDNWIVRVGILPIAPSILSQPQSQTVTAGGSVHFSVTVAGQPAPTCQWYFNGGAIKGATSNTLDLSGVRSSDAGSYVVILTNDYGNVTSSPAVLTVTAASTGTASGSSGGGGAVEAWFALALALLAAARMREQAKKGK